MPTRFFVTIGVLVVAALAWTTPARAQTAPGSFASNVTFSASGQASAVFSGGTVDQLETASNRAGATGVWVQDAAGAFQLLPINGPAFLKTAFSAQFPGGWKSATAVTLTRPVQVIVTGRVTSLDIPFGIAGLVVAAFPTDSAGKPAATAGRAGQSLTGNDGSYKLVLDQGLHYAFNVSVFVDPSTTSSAACNYFYGWTNQFSRSASATGRVFIDVPADRSGFDLVVPGGQVQLINDRAYCAPLSR